jgi:amino acid adenylation domain-containing protein
MVPSTRAPESCIHELVSAQASRAPEAVALRFGKRSLSYGALERLSNQAAWLLRLQGVGPQSIVGLGLERSLEMIVGMLGILKAGGAYLPLDPTYPRERLEFMAQDSQLRLLLTQSHLREKHHCPAECQVLCLDSGFEALGGQSEQPLDSGATSRSLAYVIYTSGSSGRPKGVLLEHAGLVNLVQSQSRALECGPGSRVLQFARLSFDAAVWEIFLALGSGATLCLATQEELMPGPGLARVLREAEITLTLLPPVALTAMPEGVEKHLGSLRTLVVGGEACSKALVERWAVGGRRFFNAYGPTEATVYCTIGECRVGANAERPSIGFELEGAEVHVLDVETLVPMRTGEAGELCVGGVGLARGYLNREQLTREKFIELPEALRAHSQSQRLYRTGDRARRLEDGSLDFLGRLDNQVKVRGYRIELGEVETVLGSVPGVKQAVVLLREDIPGEKCLVGYVLVSEGTEAPGTTALREHMRSFLPGFMVPQAFMVLNRFPITANGKVDRQSLPVPQLRMTAEYAAPRSALEKAVARIWSDVLGIPELGLSADFFELGGQSLLAAQLHSRIQQEIKTSFPMRYVLEFPKLADFCARIDSIWPSNAADAHETAGISPRLSRNEDQAPLTPSQRSLWFMSKLTGDIPLYNEVVSLSRRGELEMASLERALRTLIERHEILRTVFGDLEGKPVQLIRPEAAVHFKMKQFDLRELPSESRRGEATRLATHEATALFDLEDGPLIRACVFHLADDEHLLSICLHHIIIDGVSLHRVLLPELLSLYDAFRKGVPSLELPAPRIQYADYARWIQGPGLQEKLARDLEYWKSTLAGAPELRLPVSYPRPGLRSFVGKKHFFELQPPLVARLKALSRRQGVTLYVTLQAVFQTLLHKYSGQEDVVTGAVASQSPGGVGYFVNPWAVRVSFSGDPNFLELLARGKKAVLEGLDHQFIPFDILVRELASLGRSDQTPLLSAVFSLGAAHCCSNEPGWSVLPQEIDTGFSKFDLSLEVEEREGGGASAYFGFSTELFREAVIRRMTARLMTLLEEVAAAPARPVSQLP